METTQTVRLLPDTYPTLQGLDLSLDPTHEHNTQIFVTYVAAKNSDIVKAAHELDGFTAGQFGLSTRLRMITQRLGK